MCPKVSVIIPVYNAEKYIQMCFKTITDQSFKDWEVIFINDGSKDNSLAICLDIKEKYNNVTVIDQENKGVSEARNRGLSAAKGEYIAFVDVDDYLGVNYFSPLCNATEDLILLQYKIFDENSKVTDGENVKLLHSTNDRKIIENFFSENLHNNIMRTPWGKFIKRSVIGDARFPLGQKIGEDSVFIFNVLKNVRSMKAVDDALYMWRDHADFFIQKYQLNVDTAIEYLVNEFGAYKKIGVSSPHLEATLYFTFFALSEKSIGKQRWKWFGRPVVKAIWESINFRHKEIHRKKFKKYRHFVTLYKFLDRNKFSNPIK